MRKIDDIDEAFGYDDTRTVFVPVRVIRAIREVEVQARLAEHLRAEIWHHAAMAVMAIAIVVKSFEDSLLIAALFAGTVIIEVCLLVRKVKEAPRAEDRSDEMDALLAQYHANETLAPWPEED